MRRNFLKYPLVALMAILGFAWASAASVTFTAGVDKAGGTSAGTNLSIEKEGVTITISSGIMGNNDAYRIYSSGTLTVNSTVGAISRVVITQYSSTYPVSRLSVSSGGGSIASGVWTAENNSTSNVVFTASAQVRASKIEVFLYDPYEGKVFMDNVTMTAGQTAPVLFKMKEGSSVSAVQFTITLPQGFTPETNVNGRPVITLASARQTADHSVSGTIEGNNVKVMVYSPTAAELPTVASGDLFTMNLTPDASLQGEYEVTVSDVLASSNALGQVAMEGAAGTITVEPTAVVAQGITLDKSTLVLDINGSDVLHATVTPEGASQVVTWSSSDENIATVDENGTVTAHAAGVATITATTTDGSNLSAECTVTVNVPLATGIELNMTEGSMALGNTSEIIQLFATVTPAEASQQVTWTNTDNNVAVRDDNGNITAVGIGTTTFTATTTDGTNLSASCVFTVTAPLAEGIVLNKTETTLPVGASEQLIATVSPELASQEVTWSSSDENVVSVDQQGNITAVAIGTATVTATTVDGSNLSAECAVTVVAPFAESIALNKSEMELTVGTAEQLIATVSPELASQEVTWSSSDENIASVDAEGNVTGLAVGTATITATTVATVDGEPLSASCEVTVVAEEVKVTELAFAFEVPMNRPLKLDVTPLPADATNPELEWSTADESIAVVEDGTIRGLAVGTTTVTVSTTDGSDIALSFTVNVVEGTLNSADVNNDGVVNTGDVSAVYQAILGLQN